MMYPNYYYQPQQMQQTQVSTNGFVSVRNESEARSYPVALGNSVTFKDETAPYVYTKTMGFSQLETPRFEKYRLVKEEPIQTQEEASNIKLDNLPTKDDIDSIWVEIEALKREIFKSTQQKKKKEVLLSILRTVLLDMVILAEQNQLQ